MIRVLVVDSNVAYGPKLKKILQSLKFQVSVCRVDEDTALFLKAVKDLDCDVICLVTRSGDTMAYELCRAIRATPSFQRCPILMLVDEIEKSFVDRALSAGVTEIFQNQLLDEMVAYLRNFRDFHKQINGQVLLVEDSLAQQRLAKEMLEKIGLTVKCAVDVETAWRLFLAEPFNLLITDLLLVGDETGLLLIDRVRKLEDERSETPIIVMSGYQDNVRTVDLFRRGINDFISKPVIYEELIARSRSLITTQKLTLQVYSQRILLEKKNRSLNEFIGRISHEFRNSINIELGVSRMLSRDKSLHERHKKLIDMVRHAAEHQLSLVDDILDYLKIETGHMVLDERYCDIRDLPKTLMEMFSYKSEENDLVLTHLVDEQIPESVIVDKTKLNQILINLLGNAVKFTHSGHVSLRFQLEHIDGQSWVRCEVRDTGPGIAEGDQADIFLAFSQTEVGRSEAGGTGLGLAICTNLANLMGGYLALESQRGRGSRFFFSFPVLGRASLVRN